MSVETVRVVARLTALPEKSKELEPILQGLIAPTRREQGCISYQLLRNNAEDCDFVFVEEWTSDSALDAHLTTPHLHEALAKATPLLSKAPEIVRYSLVG